jgi:hypothetical protein
VRRAPFPLVLIALALALPATAGAAPPANDARTAPRVLTPPATVTGTTQDATLEADEPAGCQALKGSVYYEVTAAEDEQLVVRLTAQGDLDATVEVFRRTRSQLAPLACDTSDADGRAEARFRAEKGGRYLVRVGQRANSVPGTFTLEAFVPAPPPTAPGPALPRGGVTRTLDQTQDSADAWSARLREGGRYRVNLAGPAEGCVRLQVYGPGTTDFADARPVRTLRCGGYAVLNPGDGEGGRWSFLVTAKPRTAGPQPYHLQVAALGPDDAGPGLRLGDFRPFRGSLDARGVDVLDLYRFAIRRRSAVRLTLGGGRAFSLSLLTPSGRTIDDAGDGEPLDDRLGRGRYLVVVRAAAGARGRYTLTRTTRTITRTSIAIDGRRAARVGPGARTRIGVRVAPRVSGPVRITIERFDPLEGWQFVRTSRTRVRDGRGGVAFTPPTTGRWRARAAFTGTRTAAPSETGTASVVVEAPLGTR